MSLEDNIYAVLKKGTIAVVSMREVLGAILALVEADRGTCEWKYDSYHDVWNCQCGDDFTLSDGGPKHNGMKYCCYCGKRIKEVK